VSSDFPQNASSGSDGDGNSAAGARSQMNNTAGAQPQAGGAPGPTSSGGDGSDRTPGSSGGPASLGDVQQQVSQQAHQVAQQAQQHAQQAVQQAQESAGQVVSQVRDQIVSRLQEQKDSTSQGLGLVGQSLRQTSGQLHQQGQHLLGGYAETVAEQAERLVGYLNERDVARIGQEVAEFGRSRPEVFLGAAFVVGLLSARFFKSTSQPQLPPGSSGAGPSGSGSSGATGASYGEYPESIRNGRASSDSGTHQQAVGRPVNPEVLSYVAEHNRSQA
jgi:cell division septum initiation protein DivIVA